MNASKEEARKALESIKQVQASLSQAMVFYGKAPVMDELTKIRNFLIAVESKLPSEESYKKDRDRRIRKSVREKYDPKPDKIVDGQAIDIKTTNR